MTTLIGIVCGAIVAVAGVGLAAVAVLNHYAGEGVASDKAGGLRR